jgi:hypothetical protein
MDFIQTANKQVDKFGSGKHGFSAGNPSGGVPATYLSQAWCDNIQQEIVNVIEGAGIAVNPGSQTQLFQAIQAIYAGASGNDYKASVRAATVGANITLAGGAPNTLDGVTLVANDRILVKDQTTASQNGIYYVSTLGTGVNGTWTRSTDADQAGELTSGAVMAVEEGTLNADSLWMLTTDGSITIGTTALTFARKDPSAAGGSIQGGFKNLQASATGLNANISVSADEIALESGSNLFQTLRNVALTGSLASSGVNGLDNSVQTAVTISVATPGVVTQTAHGYALNAPVVFTGTVPAGLSAGTTYYVIPLTANTYNVSATKGGAAINTTGGTSAATVASVLVASSWYSVWVIWNGTTAAMLLSSSSTNPVLPTGYTHKARVGWVCTDGTGNKYPLGFTQKGRSVTLLIGSGNVSTPPVMASGSAGTFNTTTFTGVAVAWANYAPSTAAKIRIGMSAGGTGFIVGVASNANRTGYATANPPELGYNSSAYPLITYGDLLLETSNIYWGSAGGTGYLLCGGWEDNL